MPPFALVNDLGIVTHGMGQYWERMGFPAAGKLSGRLLAESPIGLRWSISMNHDTSTGAARSCLAEQTPPYQTTRVPERALQDSLAWRPVSSNRGDADLWHKA